MMSHFCNKPLEINLCWFNVHKNYKVVIFRALKHIVQTQRCVGAYPQTVFHII